jgi:hypothetical protein
MGMTGPIDGFFGCVFFERQVMLLCVVRLVCLLLHPGDEKPCVAALTA